MTLPDDWPTLVLTAEELQRMLAEAGEFRQDPPPTDDELEAMAKWWGEVSGDEE